MPNLNDKCYIVQGTASEATLVALLGAKAKALQTSKGADSKLTDADIVPKLVAYSSALSHSSVERAGLLGGVLLRALDTDGEHKLRGDTLRDAVAKDRADGLIPFFVVATLGTTSCCSFDRLDEIAEVANDVGIWVHVDAAYAGKYRLGITDAVPQYHAECSVLRGHVFGVVKSLHKFCKHTYSFYKSEFYR